MTGPHPAVAAVRLAVRAALAELEPGAVALVACSGGADSLALAHAGERRVLRLARLECRMVGRASRPAGKCLLASGK